MARPHRNATVRSVYSRIDIILFATAILLAIGYDIGLVAAGEPMDPLVAARAH
jgi:hypothetical protein